MKAAAIDSAISQRLALGTVQLGLPYGLANRTGRPGPAEAQAILATARAGGIDTLDTAGGYGDSERVIGQAGAAAWRIVTKVPALGDVDPAGRVRAAVERSLATLGVPRLYALLLHSADDALGARRGGGVDALAALQSEGLVEKIGVSIYAPDVLPRILEAWTPDLIQAPLNIIDQRLIAGGWLGRLASVGVELHVRSVFLQGLLLMPGAARPPYFAPWRDHLRRFDAFIAAHGGDPVVACLGFVKNQPGISRVVVGVESVAQLRQVLAAYDAAPPLAAAHLACDDPALIEPFRWSST